MSYVIFKGVSTEALPGVEVSKMPGHKRAAMRYTEFYVRGRNGALHTDEGYSNLDLEVTLVLIDAAATTRYAVNAWATGDGMLVLSDDPTKAFRASVKNEIKWNRVRGNRGYFDTARIIFNCQPYLYEAAETSLTVTQTMSISNPGTEEAYPTIVVNGSGSVSFTIDGKTVTIAGMTAGNPVTLDCENGYVFAESGAMTMTGDFPVFQKGIVSINPGTASSLVITPHWRWI